MTVFAAWFALRRDATPNPRLGVSIARASSRVTSVVPGGASATFSSMSSACCSSCSLRTPASIQDRDGAVPVLREAHCKYPTLEHVWVDNAYQGGGIEDIKRETGLRVEVVKRSEDQKGFVVLPKRRIVGASSQGRITQSVKVRPRPMRYAPGSSSMRRTMARPGPPRATAPETQPQSRRRRAGSPRPDAAHDVLEPRERGVSRRRQRLDAQMRAGLASGVGQQSTAQAPESLRHWCSSARKLCGSFRQRQHRQPPR